MIPGRFISRNCCSSAWTRKRRFRSSTFGPYSTRRYLSPSARQTTAGAPFESKRRLSIGSSRVPVAGSTGSSPESVSRHASTARFNSKACSRDNARNRTMSPALSCPIFHSSASTIVTSEIDRAHRVGVVVNIGGVKTSFAAIFASPPRLWTDQPHASAVRIVVHLPRRPEKHVKVFRSEKIRGPMRPVEDANLPLASVLRNQTLRKFASFSRVGLRVIYVQYVSRAQRATRLTTEFPKDEGGAAGKIRRCFNAAANREISACPHALSGSHLQDRAARDKYCPPGWHRLTVQPRTEISAAQSNPGVTSKTQGWARDCYFKSGGAGRVAN